ncbi:glycosyltransferase family 2 protein [Megamonas funiformis]|uniref:glycosyltransferase family 2 protein n=1 Tax=Megamonas funiformis TaxID=437897 RepID=UPI000E4B1773|nr:glycosyltransferase family 2 protein [Megamonas funiformis]RHG08044.1 glycosyltransferase family 2 protein [Megamonas funiformis]
MISVIMPLYNNEKYVIEAIKSVINQTYKDWELIIINDASTDNSKFVVQNFLEKEKDNRIVFIDLKENKGVSFARNLGMKKAKGEYISFLDSDDLWDKNFLNELYRKIKETNGKLVYSKFAYFYNGDNIKINKAVMREGKIDKFIVKKKCRYETEYPFHICAILVKKSLIETYKIKFPEEQNLFEDGLFLSKLICITDIVSVNKVLMYYRQHQTSITHKKYTKKEYLQELLFLERLLDFTKIYNIYFYNIVYKYYIYRVYRVILIILKKDKIESSIKLINKYNNILNFFIRDDYYKWNDRLKCRMILLNSKILLKVLKYF